VSGEGGRELLQIGFVWFQEDRELGAHRLRIVVQEETLYRLVRGLGSGLGEECQLGEHRCDVVFF